MSDHGRYDYDITTGNRSYGERDRERDRDSGGGFSRNSGSMFDMGGSRERDRVRDERNEQQHGGRWTRERENLGSESGRDHDRHEFSRGNMDRDHGKRMSSGWGGLVGEPVGRDRSHEHRGHEHRSREHMHGDLNRSRGGRDRDYGRDDHRDGLPIDETGRLIASNKVEGTAVYGSDGHRLGSIFNFMVDKRSGKVEYAVMTYGGMLGMGKRYYPLPWEMLTYDTDEGGYRINMTERDLEDAPSFDRDSEPQFNRSYGEHVNSWYGLGRR